MSNHIEDIDIAKGIGICCIVMHHSGVPNYFIHPFEVALFFFIAGYFFKLDTVNSLSTLKKYIGKRIEKLYIPFTVYNVIFIILNNAFLKIGFYTTDERFLSDRFVNNYLGLDDYLTISKVGKQIVKVLCLADTAKIGGVSWFIRALIVIELGYAVITFFLKRWTSNRIIRLHVILSSIMLIAMLLADWLKIIMIPAVILDLCSYYIIYSIGVLFGERGNVICFEYKHFIISMMIIVVNGIVRMFIDTGIDKITCILSAFPAFYLCCYIANLLIKKNDFARNFFIRIAALSMPILFLQLIGYKISAMIQVAIYHLPRYDVASFPSLTVASLWIPVNMFFGIAIPAIVARVYSLGIRKIG